MREDLDDEDVSAATLVSAGLALSALRHDPDVLALARNHGLHQAIRDVDRFRSRYAALSPAP